MKYFTLKELCNTNTGLNNVPTWEAVDNLKLLVTDILDPIRDKWGKAINISSGYRSQEVNKAVSGSIKSQHMKGQAVDIDIGAINDNKKLFDFIISTGIVFDQLILENKGEWIHISYNINKNRREILYIVDVK